MLSTYLAAIEATGGDVLAASKALGIPESSLRSRIRREGLWERVEAIRFAAKTGPTAEDEDEGLTEENGVKVGVVQPETPWSAEDVIRFYGDDPDECEILSKRGTFWGQPESPNHHLRVNWISKADLIHAPDPNDWTPPPKPKKRKKETYLDAVVISDHHAPHHEPTFHRLFLEYLGDAQPGLIEVNGDLLDFSTISRHREREGAVASVNECLNAGFGILRDYREVCPDAQIRFKRGNHSERLRHMIIDNAKGLHKITPAGEETEALSLRRLLHLDSLHIEYIDVEWDQAKTKLSKKLTARHGFSTSKNAGEQMLDKLSGSTIQGHSHRAGITLRTEHTDDPDDPIRVRMAIEGGCACIIPGGLSYVAGGEPNWQNAFGAFRIWNDGDFHADLGIYLPGRLLAPNGQRYVR